MTRAVQGYYESSGTRNEEKRWRKKLVSRWLPSDIFICERPLKRVRNTKAFSWEVLQKSHEGVVAGQTDSQSKKTRELTSENKQNKKRELDLNEIKGESSLGVSMGDHRGERQRRKAIMVSL